MTTPDSKYKHKPSEKHTLEEVLKSLQDMIRNDLLDDERGDTPAEKLQPLPTASKSTERGDRPGPIREDFAPVTPGSGPVNFDAVMRSLKDLISHELDTGDNLHSDANASETTPDEDKADLSQSEEFAPLDEGLTFEDTAMPTVHKAATPADESLSPFDDQTSEELAPDEFEPLDEEISFEGPIDIASAPKSDAALPELPGEISPELLREQESEPASASPVPVGEEDIASSIQQEFTLDDLPPRVIESEAFAPDDMHEPESTSDIETGSPQDTNGIDAPLPTIEVEETFDENNYFQSESPPSETLPSELQEVQEIIATALGAPPETEAPPQDDASQSGGQEHQDQDLTPAKETESAPKNTLEALNDNGFTLEIAEESDAEHYKMPVVDFDSDSLKSPAKEQKPPSEASNEIPLGTENAIPQDTGVKDEPEPGKEITPDNRSTALDSKKTRKTRRNYSSKAKTADLPSSSNLDDIPVLKDVVSPSTGSTLKAEPPSTPSKDRLPRPNRAREIVVRAVAKLNVEMRKTGGTGIDTKTILRLQKLIQEQLEKDGDE
jgi:hypothetical protein